MQNTTGPWWRKSSYGPVIRNWLGDGGGVAGRWGGGGGGKQCVLKAEIWVLSKSQRDIIDGVIISTIIAFDMICNVAYHSAAKSNLPI